MTEALFRDDPYLKTLEATVVDRRDDGALVFDRTLFYAVGGGQPSDIGTLTRADGTTIPIVSAAYGDDAKVTILHRSADGASLPEVGERVVLALDWASRYRHMRMHTALHLLSVALPYAVTGGSIGAAESRLDFDIPDPDIDREAIEAAVNATIAGDHPVSFEWITDAELDANPGLVKTLSVKPPRGTGRIRLVRIGHPDATVDLQPCGGTHVRSTAEIGRIAITKIEKKGKINRRVRIALVDDAV